MGDRGDINHRTTAGGIPVHRVPTPLARRFHQICTSVLVEALAGYDLTPTQFAALRHLADEPDIDQNGLAMRLGIDHVSTGQLVERLEAIKLVERRINGADRRARCLQLTRKGKLLEGRVRPKVRAAHQRMLAPLGVERGELLLDLLVELVTANEAYARPGAARRKPRRPVAKLNSAKEKAP
jgi:DNA-binding MarR family transcriptional regulator